MSAAGVLVETVDGHGHVRSRQRIQPDAASRFVVGRGVDADLVLDDPHVAARHVEVEACTDGAVRVTDLGTINGVIVAGRRHHGVQSLDAPAGEFRIGRTLLRVRTPAQPIAPERPDRTVAYATRSAAWVSVIAATLCALYVVYLNWLGAPRDLLSHSVAALLGAMSVAGVWIALWALLSRVLLGEWRWLAHAATAFGAAAAFIVLDNVLDLIWFGLGLPPWSLRDTLLAALVFTAALHQHLRQVVQRLRLRAAGVAVLVPVVLVGAGLWVKQRAQVRDVNHIDAGERIFPSALRLRPAAEAGTFFARLGALKPAADTARDALAAPEAADARRP